jgi:hypothetical protein
LLTLFRGCPFSGRLEALLKLLGLSLSLLLLHLLSYGIRLLRSHLKHLSSHLLHPHPHVGCELGLTQCFIIGLNSLLLNLLELSSLLGLSILHLLNLLLHTLKLLLGLLSLHLSISCHLTIMLPLLSLLSLHTCLLCSHEVLGRGFSWRCRNGHGWSFLYIPSFSPLLHLLVPLIHVSAADEVGDVLPTAEVEHLPRLLTNLLTLLPPLHGTDTCTSTCTNTSSTKSS